ncbi:MAG: hypothetical protein ACTSSB_04705 [Candidatus Heimdallarchaeota archaeon]
MVLCASVLLVINGIHISFISGEWLVSPSDDVSYVIDDSTWDVHLDGVDATGTGGYFEGITVNKGRQFN